MPSLWITRSTLHNRLFYRLGDIAQWGLPVDVPVFYRYARHPIYDARVLVLRDRHPAGFVDFADLSGSIAAHAGHDNRHGVAAEVLSSREKENPRGGAMTVARFVVVEVDDAGQFSALYLHV